ncbi:MAG: pantoate--beta-alanine ligase [Adhaeribacter sp.]
MTIIESLPEIKHVLQQVRASGKTLGFVPTMGALHAGHLQLLQTARAQNQVVVCSIFVNPIQFNKAEDFQHYPRVVTEDVALLEQQGCDYLFLPQAADMYPRPLGLSFSFGSLETVMEGRFRPGHFSGVAAVVSKLFHLVNPHKAYFGQKDLQQFAIVRRLVEDLNFNLELVCHPIIRESDGLAMSSRNRRLGEPERRQAVQLYQSLEMARTLLASQPVEEVKEAVTAYLQPFDRIRLEYFEVVDAASLQPLAVAESPEGIALCIAAYLGEIRLIDNVVIAAGELPAAAAQ